MMKPHRNVFTRSPLRLGAFVAAVAVIVLGLVFRLIQVQLVHGEEYHRAANANQIRLIPVAAPRGIMYDRTGHVLVRNRPSFVVALIPSEVKNVTDELHTLAKTINIPEPLLLQRLYHHHGVNYDTFDQVQVYEPYGPVILASDLSGPQMARLAELRNDLPGVDLEAQPVRDYPTKTFGSHLFGYVGQISEDEFKDLQSQGYLQNDVIGKDGLEQTYDKYLRGTPGGEQIEVDSQGQVSKHLSTRPYVEGASLMLSIDWHLQEIAERALANGLKSWGHGRPLAGAVVIEDPWTGGILAMASYPNFNPNDFAVAISGKKFSHYILDPQRPLYNRAIGAATPTGSTFKMITGSAAITAHKVRVNEAVYDSGSWNCGGALFRDIASGGLGSTTFVHALAASSDGYFYQMAWRLGNPLLRYYALQYGLNKASGVDLPGEYAGNWPTNAWSLKVTGLPLEPSDVCSLGIGQGAMQATPLQMADVLSTVLNGGTLYRPHIVRQIRDRKGRIIKTFDHIVNNHVPVSHEALAAVREGMSKVTDPGGTAYGLAIEHFHYGGKTGTVETQGGRGPNTTWFVAYAPTEKPQMAMAVFVDRSGGYGAQVAAPIARQIMVEYFHKKP
ncbi:MAG: penicillin-binding protein 2 [Candidatus Eremiobacteraeota bacterium]|nr:penicillin-binding protein 2 [Candidatus Eremiobacteraeota bacterium]